MMPLENLPLGMRAGQRAGGLRALPGQDVLAGEPGRLLSVLRMSTSTRGRWWARRLLLLVRQPASCSRASSGPYLLVGWLWFLGMLVPVIGLVQVGSQSLANRYTYLPHIGIMLAISFGSPPSQPDYCFMFSCIESISWFLWLHSVRRPACAPRLAHNGTTGLLERHGDAVPPGAGAPPE